MRHYLLPNDSILSSDTFGCEFYTWFSADHGLPELPTPAFSASSSPPATDQFPATFVLPGLYIATELVFLFVVTEIILCF